nr:hypothetical protein [Tanacetum cinerariifolium]
MNHQTSSILQIAYQSPPAPTKLMIELPLVDSGLAILVFSPGDDPIAFCNKEMAFLTVVASSRGDKGKVILVLVIRVMLLVLGEAMQLDWQELLNATTIKEAGQILDEEQLAVLVDPGIPNAILMAIVSNYGSDNISEKAQQIKPTLYDGIIISDKHVDVPVIDDEETLILEKVSRSKMSKTGKDPEAIKQNISYKPIDYVKLNQLSEDFGKRFTPQQELSAEQAFWFCISKPIIESSNKPPVKVEVPCELPKKRTTPNAHTEGEWGFEHAKAVFNNEIIPFLKSLRDIFNVFG